MRTTKLDPLTVEFSSSKLIGVVWARNCMWRNSAEYIQRLKYGESNTMTNRY